MGFSVQVDLIQVNMLLSGQNDPFIILVQLIWLFQY